MMITSNLWEEAGKSKMMVNTSAWIGCITTFANSSRAQPDAIILYLLSKVIATRQTGPRIISSATISERSK